ncbi:MAG: bifunctional (p)ppGpp synthetase/guanosine-3',5'-bis(diphosphate) 3'-pyrophosphohydrolase [Clostridia bacterium]|nr:bifunctional (p)ppGpp synthetase/guanosine-3',5'-bis(diphosphate) 3'-pyrophosphohydrolase [Clostridia bacterium]
MDDAHKPDIIQKAKEFAKKAHEGQFRESGEPYFVHPEHVAQILMELGLDDDTIAAGYLHDVVEDCGYTYEDIEKNFNSKIAELVLSVTKLDKMKFASKEEAQAENTRNMMLAMAQDIRVIFIKLADRLHNMRTLQYRPQEKIIEVCKETLDIYAPLAHRLGISKIKWELEDLAFAYSNRDEYQRLSKKVAMRRQQREDIVNKKIEMIQEALKEHGISGTIEGRPKHFYSIYRKMQAQSKPFEEIYDLTAIRIIVDDLKSCYGALGVVHTMWTPIPGRFKDYIAMPKSNLYQSIHTTLMGEHGVAFEVQIRTEKMHEIAEYGIAAHWLYKEKKSDKSGIDEELSLFRSQILELKDTSSNAMEFVNTLKVDLVQETVYVFSPKGDVYNLPVGSNPIDFAYKVHSAVGNKCVGAKINNKMVSIDTELQTGDIVEIITSNNSNGPSMDWIKIAKTPQARSKIRAYLKKEGKEGNILKGKTMLEEAAKKGAVPLSRLTKNEYIDKLCEKLYYKRFDDILAAIGYGELTSNQVYQRLLEEYRKENKQEDIPVVPLAEDYNKDYTKGQNKENATSTGGVTVKGERNMLVRYAGCCNPVPYDPIIGFITRGRGVSIHRKDCYNVTSQGHDPSRYIEVAWEQKVEKRFQAALHVRMHDEPGLLVRISNTMQSLNVSLIKMNAEVNVQSVASIDMTVELSKKEQLVTLIHQFKKMPECIDIYRKNG